MKLRCQTAVAAPLANEPIATQKEKREKRKGDKREKGTGYFFIEGPTVRMLEALRAANSTRTAGRIRLPRH